MMQFGVLYIDDEIHNLNSFKAAFRRDFNIHVAQSAREGRKILEQNEIAVIVTDQRMPVMTGIEFLESIIPVYPDTIRILLTGFSDINAVMDAINRGQVYKYLVKPWRLPERPYKPKTRIFEYFLPGTSTVQLPLSSISASPTKLFLGERDITQESPSPPPVISQRCGAAPPCQVYIC